MADFTNIKAEIDAKIVPDNHAQLITGKRLNDTLQDLVDAVDEKKQDTLTETQNANINAVPNKVDKVTGKGLSTNDYTTAEKNKLAGLENYDDAAIKGRVSVIEGKEAGWDAKYSKPNTGIPATDLASGVQTTLGKVTELEQNVGSLPSLTTEEKSNLVGAVNEVNAKKANTDGYYEGMTVGNAGNLAGNVVEDAMFTRRTSGGYASIKSGAATIKALKGNTIVWNQLNDRGLHLTNATTDTATALNLRIRLTASPYAILLSKTGINTAANIKEIVTASFSGLVTLLHTGLSANIEFAGNVCTVLSGHIYLISFNLTSVDVTTVGGISIDNLNIFDLTQMFGAGNEPSTVEEFEALFPLDYYAYNAGELLSFNGTGIKTDGFNQWDGSKARVFGGQAYYINGTYSTLKFAKTIDGEQTDITPSSNLYTPTEDGYIFATGTSAEFCINLSHSGIRNGEYEPYWTETKQLPALDFFDVQYTGADGQQHTEGGMKSAGTAKDEWNGTKKVRRIGVVDLGTLTWIKATAYGHDYFRTDTIPLAADSMRLNVRCPKYTTQSLANPNAPDKIISGEILTGNKRINILDSSYTDAASFKASLAGVLLFYELAEPVEADAEPLGIYKEDDWGTETLLPENDDEPTTSPIIADIMYGIDAVGTIRNLPKDYISKVSMDSVLSAMVSAGIIGGYTLTYNGRSYDCTITPISTE